MAAARDWGRSRSRSRADRALPAAARRVADEHDRRHADHASWHGAGGGAPGHGVRRRSSGDTAGCRRDVPTPGRAHASHGAPNRGGCRTGSARPRPPAGCLLARIAAIWATAPPARRSEADHPAGRGVRPGAALSTLAAAVRARSVGCSSAGQRRGAFHRRQDGVDRPPRTRDGSTAQDAGAHAAPIDDAPAAAFIVPATPWLGLYPVMGMAVAAGARGDHAHDRRRGRPSRRSAGCRRCSSWRPS